MGMAASQARFLSLTARKSNVEWEGQQVNQQRTALSNESANLYNQLNSIKVPTPPAVSDYTTVKYTFKANDLDTSSTTSTEYTLENIYSTPAGSYARLNYTTYAWDSAVTSAYYGTISKDASGNKSVNLANGLSFNAIEYTYEPEDVVLQVKPSSSNTFNIAGQSFTADSSGKYITCTVGDNTYSYPIEDKGNGVYQVTITTENAKAQEGYDFDIAGQSFHVTYNSNGSYTIDGDIEGAINSAVDGRYKNVNGNKTFKNTLFGDDFTTVYTQESGKLYNQPILSYMVDNQSYYISATENSRNAFSGSYYLYERPTNTSAEYPCAYSTSENGRYKTLTITDDQGKTHTYNLNVANEQDEYAYQQAMLDYEYDQARYEKQIKDINAKTEKIQQEDRTLELRLKQLDTEQNAIKTEMESVKKVIEDNVESTFKTFA